MGAPEPCTQQTWLASVVRLWQCQLRRSSKERPKRAPRKFDISLNLDVAKDSSVSLTVPPQGIVHVPKVSSSNFSNTVCLTQTHHLAAWWTRPTEIPLFFVLVGWNSDLERFYRAWSGLIITPEHLAKLKFRCTRDLAFPPARFCMLVPQNPVPGPHVLRASPEAKRLRSTSYLPSDESSFKGEGSATDAIAPFTQQFTTVLVLKRICDSQTLTCGVRPRLAALWNFAIGLLILFSQRCRMNEPGLVPPAFVSRTSGHLSGHVGDGSCPLRTIGLGASQSPDGHSRSRASPLGRVCAGIGGMCPYVMPPLCVVCALFTNLAFPVDRFKRLSRKTTRHPSRTRANHFDS